VSEWREMLGADILTLGMAADERRRQALGANVVTYLRVAEAKAGAAEVDARHAGEVRVYAPPERFDEAVSQLRAVRSAAPHCRIAAFSFADLVSRGWSAPSQLRTLAEAGMDDVAELPADQLDELDAALARMTEAGLQPARLTIAQPITGDRAELIVRVQAAFRACPSLRRFSPLPRVAPVDKPTTGYDDVRMVAVSRLALPERSIEVDWQLYGPKLAQVALTFGADHLDAVPTADDESLGRRRTTVEDVERNIRAAGFEPREYRITR
jgi:hypothetical protein